MIKAPRPPKCDTAPMSGALRRIRRLLRVVGLVLTILGFAVFATGALLLRERPYPIGPPYFGEGCVL
jgi:hypothetical protein